MMGVVTLSWTEAELLILRARYAAGATMSEIVEELGKAGFSRTRNSVIGRCHREGLLPRTPVRPSASAAPKQPRQKPAPIAVSARPRLVRGGPVRAAEPPASTVSSTVAGWPKPMTDTAVRFLDAAFEQCRMILNDRAGIDELMVCGAKVITGKAWCRACALVVWEPRAAVALKPERRAA